MVSISHSYEDQGRQVTGKSHLNGEPVIPTHSKQQS